MTRPKSLLTVQDAARLFRVTEQTIQEWIRNGLRTHSKGRKGQGDGLTIRLHDMVKWYFEENGELLSLDRHRAALAKVQADKITIENAVRCGELIPLADTAEWYGRHVDRARARLVQIPDAIGQLCDPRSASAITNEARRIVDEALAELARGHGRAH